MTVIPGIVQIERTTMPSFQPYRAWASQANALASAFVSLILATVMCIATSPPLLAAADDVATPDYNTHVAPLLRKYCAGCHNAEDREGKLALDSYAGLLAGGKHGAAITPGHGELSRMVRMLTGQAKPKMPPEGEAAPKPDEIALLTAWIDAGAKGPAGAEPDPTLLVTPKIEPTVVVRQAVSAVAVSPRGDVVALARYGEVELQSLPDRKPLKNLSGHRGNVNAVAFSSDGRWLIAAAGEPGLFGEARLWNVADGQLLQVFQGHKDSLFAARLSPDRKLLATGGYDQKILFWDTASGQLTRTLEGHNGAVFDLAFRPDGKILASASGDRTVKLWNVATGARLDTFGQSLQELYTVAFAPDGKRLAAAGVDNRIRVWAISPSGKEGTSPLLFSRFAHDAAILRLEFSADGRSLVSTAEDRLIKIWDAESVTIRATLPLQSEWVTGVAIAPDGKRLFVGRLDGTTGQYPLTAATAQQESPIQRLAEVPPPIDYGPQPPIDKLPKTPEVEPNDTPDLATSLAVPGIATGRIFANGRDVQQDADLFRIEAKAGDQWIIETNAARSGSPLDTKIEVLHADGRPVERLLLRAVRDSEIEFRSIDSTNRGARLKNWEEMHLNQYVYLSGEVCKLYQQRRGPDSDSPFYPEGGSRFSYFDTSAQAHALGELCYIVEPYPVGTELPNNGLPVFPVYFENDDDARRALGKDSRLTFVAPADGAYLVRVSDVRGFSGESFSYQLIVRRPQPDFKVTLTGNNPTVNADSGKSFTVKAERLDNFNGPIRVDISGLPPGFTVTSPIVIEEGHLEAKGAINALPDAPATNEQNWALSKLAATAEIAGRQFVKDAGSLGTIKLADKPKILVYLEPTGVEKPSDAVAALPEIVIAPGATITCELRVERNGFDGRIQFDVENLPHGVIVDNIGLSGVLIPEGTTHRTIFLTAEDWVPETSRLFHAVAKAEGDQASLPMRLHVRRGETKAD
jgi:hypothetical protein